LRGLAIHLEIFIKSGEGALTQLVFEVGDGGNDDDIEAIAAKTNKKIQATLKKDVLNRPEFVHLVEDGPVGSHSVRKLSSTHARKNGCGKDEKDIRVDGKKEGAFLMSTMALICPIQMLKLLVGYVLEVLASMCSRKAVGLLAIFFWNTSCGVFEPGSPLQSQKFRCYHSCGQYSKMTTIIYLGK
jgi:hypothetical protein